MVLASVFPLSERSAVNVLGAFHTEDKYRVEFESTQEFLNSTSISITGVGSMGTSVSASASTSGDGKRTGTNSITLNYGFYSKFWGLQELFTDPRSLLPKAASKAAASQSNTQNQNRESWSGNLDRFIMDLRDVLAAFEGQEFPKDLVKDLTNRWNHMKRSPVGVGAVEGDGNGDGNGEGAGADGDGDGNGDAEMLTDRADGNVDMDKDMNTDVDMKGEQESSSQSTGVSASASASASTLSTKRQYKYLTNSQLLRLQLQDPELRIHFLTQLFILSTYLSTSLALYASANTGTGTSTNISAGNDVNKMVCEKIQSSLHQLQKRAGDLMKRTPPNGEAHFNTLGWILKERESVWRNWKKDKCTPPIERFDDGKNDLVAGAGARIGNGALGATRAVSNPSIAERAKAYLFEIDLRKDLPAISQAMSQPQKNGMNQFLDEYADALDPEAGIEEEYHPKNNKLSCWRALRSLSKTHIGSYADDKDGHCMIQKRTGDFEGIVRKVWKEEKAIDIPGDMPIAEVLPDENVKKITDLDDEEGKVDVENDNESESENANEDGDTNMKVGVQEGTVDSSNEDSAMNDTTKDEETQNDAEDKAKEKEKKLDKTDNIDEAGEIDESESIKMDPHPQTNDKDVKKDPIKSKTTVEETFTKTKIEETKLKKEEEKGTRSKNKPSEKSETSKKTEVSSKEVKLSSNNIEKVDPKDSRSNDRKRKRDDIPEDKATEPAKYSKSGERANKTKNVPVDSNSGSGNGNGEKTRNHDDTHGRAPTQRNNSTSSSGQRQQHRSQQRSRRTPEPRQQQSLHQPPQRKDNHLKGGDGKQTQRRDNEQRGGDNKQGNLTAHRRGNEQRGGDNKQASPPTQRRNNEQRGGDSKRSRSPPHHPRREVRDTQAGRGTHTRFMSPDGRDDRGGRRGQPDSRRPLGGGSGGGGEGPRKETSARGRGGGQGDRRGGGNRGSGDHSDRRSSNDGGRHRRRGRN